MNREKSNIVFVDNIDSSVFNLLSDLVPQDLLAANVPVQSLRDNARVGANR